MRRLPLVALLIATSLTGCETMFAHYRMPRDMIVTTARLNALSNYCLAHGKLAQDKAYAFSTVSANLVDISVVDTDLFRIQYDIASADLKQLGVTTINGRTGGCTGMDEGLLDLTAQVHKLYSSIAAQLHSARAAEISQMTATLNGFGRKYTPGTLAPMPQQAFPKINYVDQPSNSLYLVNTSRGIVQCRVTSKSYVFCM